MSNPADAVAHALRLHREGRLDEAEAAYTTLLARHPDDFDGLHLLGVIRRQRGRPDEAIELIARAIALRPSVAAAHANLGNALIDAKRFAEAAVSFERALSLKPGDALVHGCLGNARRAEGKHAEAASHYRRAITLDPGNASVHAALADTLMQLGDFAEARASFERAIAFRPDAAVLHYNLGNALKTEGRLAEAAACYERAFALKPDYANAHLNLGNVRKEQGRIDDAIACYERAAALQPDLANAHYNLGVLLQDQGRMEEACERHRRALAIDPHHGMAKLAMCVAQLPVIAESEADVSRQREAYATALEGLCEDAAASAEARRRLAEGLGAAQPFFLAYQGRNDRGLQSRYGGLVCDIMGERFPPAAAPAPPRPGEPIRVGIVSGFFWNHSNWKIPIKGWLSQLDRRRFELYGYYLDQRQDDATLIAEGLCRRFVRGPLPLNRWRQEILADRPHVLIYPEVGMYPLAPLLAAQRLAPVQCNSWGHPDTSGFPTLDYYLSSDLMEPADADEHYTETLVRLPNLSIYYEPVEVEPARLERAALGLRPDATVYWCCQSLFKYLPQFDAIFPRIAQGAGDCQFVFLETRKGRHVTNLFLERLGRAFTAFGLDARRHCVVLPYLPRERFHGAMACCDVFLDSIGWSGCNSALESLGRDLPIMTLRSGLMRGRHSAAILEMMDLPDLIADGVEDYIAIAVRMARDPAWRQEMRRRTAASKHRLWRDRTCITALETFLEQAVRRAALEGRASSAA
jgi:predicted O-linked N-acetylglucosamine transferase (SPINDLY family)